MNNGDEQTEKSFRPELRIELTCNAAKKSSVVGIKTASEAIVLLEGVKELIEDHMILIYLDKGNVVTGIDAFLHNIEELMRGEPNRALSRTITHFSGSNRVDQVIIIQALPNTRNPNINSIKSEMLATIAAKMLLFDITTIDCILLGIESYFSYKETDGAWEILQKAVRPQLEFLGVESKNEST